MKKTALALAIPLAVVAASLAGAWYTGTRVEAQITESLEAGNAALRDQAPGLDIQVSLLGLERGLFASDARYQIAVRDLESGESSLLEIADHLEHGPFPWSRLARGQLLPVMAQSNFRLEPTPFARRWFEAAGGESPLRGEVAIGYGDGRQGEVHLAALRVEEPGTWLSLAAADFDFSVADDGRKVRVGGALPRLELSGVEPDSGQAVRIEMLGMGMEIDKRYDAAGFGLGPGAFSARSIRLQVGEQPPVVLRDATFEEALAQGERGLDQTVAYRIGGVEVQEQALGRLTLALSARQLDAEALQALGQTYRQIALSGLDPDDPLAGMTPVQRVQLQAQALRLLEGGPRLALDELSLKTARGEARLSLAVDLRKPDERAATPDQMLDSALAALDAEVRLDKPLIGDLVLLKGGLQGVPAASAALQREADAATELFSGMALNAGWARLDGATLKSTLHYADRQVTFNGQPMSLEDFVNFVLGSAHGLGLQ